MVSKLYRSWIEVGGEGVVICNNNKTRENLQGFQDDIISKIGEER